MITRAPFYLEPESHSLLRFQPRFSFLIAFCIQLCSHLLPREGGPLITTVLLLLQLGLQRPQKLYCNASSTIGMLVEACPGEGTPQCGTEGWKNPASPSVPFRASPSKASPSQSENCTKTYIIRGCVLVAQSEGTDIHAPAKNVCFNRTFTAPAANGRRKAERGTRTD